MEFMFPVKYTGVRYARVQAENLEEAVKQVKSKAELVSRFELNMSEAQFDVLVPRLVLTDEEKLTWPYWEYGYSGTDGVDWRVGYTDKGQSSIPDYAETRAPVPSDWLDSWVK